MTSDGAFLASHYQSPYLRQLPYYRTCLSSIAHSCNPVTGPPSLRLRRTAYLVIIILRTIEALLFMFTFYVRKPSWLILAALLIFATFVFVAWNLHLIVEAEGERTAFKFRIPSVVFSVFMWVVVVVHVILVGLEVTGLSYYVDGTQKTWGFWILIICLVAWVAGREPEEGSLTIA